MSEVINLDTSILDALDGNENRKYYISRYCPEFDHICSGGSRNELDIMWNMYGVVVFSIKEEWVREVHRLTKSYEENDIDSLDAVSVIGIIEDKLNVTFSDKDLSQVKDFKSLEKIISKKL